MFRCLQPCFCLDSVQEITLEFLRQHQLQSLLLDVDSTLKRYTAAEIPPENVQWIELLQQAGIGLCLLSNGCVPRIRPVADQLGLPFIAPAMKPSPFGCRSGMQSMQFDPKTTAMVGDQVFADILAGKLAGIRTILITPIHPEEEHWYTRMKRPLERWVLHSSRQNG